MMCSIIHISFVTKRTVLKGGGADCHNIVHTNSNYMDCLFLHQTITSENTQNCNFIVVYGKKLLI